MKEVSVGLNFGAKEYDLLFLIANKRLGTDLFLAISNLAVKYRLRRATASTATLLQTLPLLQTAYGFISSTKRVWQSNYPSKAREFLHIEHSIKLFPYYVDWRHYKP